MADYTDFDSFQESEHSAFNESELSERNTFPHELTIQCGIKRIRCIHPFSGITPFLATVRTGSTVWTDDRSELPYDWFSPLEYYGATAYENASGFIGLAYRPGDSRENVRYLKCTRTVAGHYQTSGEFPAVQNWESHWYKETWTIDQHTGLTSQYKLEDNSGNVFQLDVTDDGEIITSGGTGPTYTPADVEYFKVSYWGPFMFGPESEGIGYVLDAGRSNAYSATVSATEYHSDFRIKITDGAGGWQSEKAWTVDIVLENPYTVADCMADAQAMSDSTVPYYDFGHSADIDIQFAIGPGPHVVETNEVLDYQNEWFVRWGYYQVRGGTDGVLEKRIGVMQVPMGFNGKRIGAANLMLAQTVDYTGTWDAPDAGTGAPIGIANEFVGYGKNAHCGDAAPEAFYSQLQGKSQSTGCALVMKADYLVFSSADAVLNEFALPSPAATTPDDGVDTEPTEDTTTISAWASGPADVIIPHEDLTIPYDYWTAELTGACDA